MEINKIRAAIYSLNNIAAHSCSRGNSAVYYQLAEWLSDYIDCRNELCEKCGKYRSVGGCDGCKFEKED